MIEVLKKQYALVRGSRAVVLEFIGKQVGKDMNKPVPAYDNQTIRYLLVHIANTYFQWLAYFGLKKPFDLIDDHGFTQLDLIRTLYMQVDDTVALFLENFDGKMEEAVYGTLSRNRQVSATPLQLFTHVLTHEFHHKGQIMSMCRLLGHIPPDTDVIRF